MQHDSQKTPAHENVYRTIRDMILRGDFAPGQPVTIQGLAELLGAGMTPVREAIRRLTSEGALQFQGNRRVSVPELTEAQIDEILFARTILEPELARIAATRVTVEELCALTTTDAALDAAIERGDAQGYLHHNYRFHMTLYEASGAEVLLPLVRTLWLRAAPSLRVMCGLFGTRNLPDMHQMALEALRRGDAEAVARALEADIRQGMENVRLALFARAGVTGQDNLIKQG
ncbi:DNA-binding GntR family transcriptional regulator [Rhodovulum bhavnagarense]|uniref:DNA-binding GntR family transcriptional regulator n=1 Tax=Rhodovulum bhavnagarense TaxID=992286 RepID=A0A4R2RFP5_9RHOB|nr:GntR family transcriptional regulator [Rhodovulum bhavnagarense]TCP61328.1 DNA-binding GntR family transcriptional regulator [Rhodovulum bhavnagarense]